MAAMVDRPVSAMSNSLDPVASQRQRDVEIIDVDSIDDPIPASRHMSAQPQPRPLQRRSSAMNGASEREEVIVLDSDEDEHALRTSSAARRASRSRLFSPPPQPYRPSPVPPVPPVPPRYASHTSFPIRRLSPSAHLPPVRPINRPFDFEAHNNQRAAGPSNSRRPPRSPPLHASAPSHHVPSMGLGGALISNYRESQRQANPQPGLLARAGAAASGLANRLSRNLVNIGMGPEVNTLALNFGSHDDNALARLLVETEMQELFGDLNHRHLLRHLSRDRHPQSATYQAAYTHSSPAEAGFTNDFASEATSTNSQIRKNSAPIIIDDDVLASSTKRAHWTPPGSVKSSTVLACARCLDPLVLGAGLVGDEGERRKIWALRCGHMIDGKCLMEIGHPPDDATDEETASRIDTKGKGKAPASPAKGKGKGKAKVPDDSATERENDNSGASLASMTVETNSIRSRLRSSRTYSTGSIPELPPSSLSNSAATRRKRPRKPRIEGQYQYRCPVPGCGHAHVSVKVNGKWRPERDDDRKKPGGRRTVKFPNDLGVDIDGTIDVRGRGAIPVFV